MPRISGGLPNISMMSLVRNTLKVGILNYLNMYMIV